MASKMTLDKAEIPQRIVGALADEFKKSPLTIQRWIEAVDDRLTSDKAKAVYKKEGFVWPAPAEG